MGTLGPVLWRWLLTGWHSSSAPVYWAWSGSRSSRGCGHPNARPVPKLRLVSCNPWHLFSLWASTATVKKQPVPSVSLSGPSRLLPPHPEFSRVSWAEGISTLRHKQEVTRHEEKERVSLGHELPAMGHWKRASNISGMKESKRWASLMQSKGLQKPQTSKFLLKTKTDWKTKIKPESSQFCPVPSLFRDPSHKSTEDWTWGRLRQRKENWPNLPWIWGHQLMFWHFC